MSEHGVQRHAAAPEELQTARRASFALAVGRLRDGDASLEPAYRALPDADFRLLAALLAVLDPNGGEASACDAFWQGQDAYADLDATMALKARYGAAAAALDPVDRTWLQTRLGGRLAELVPDWAAVPPRAALQRFDARAAGLDERVVLEGRTVAGLLAVVGGSTGRIAAPKSALEVLPEPVKGRTVWVNGQEVQITENDDLRLNLAVGVTVGIVAFLAVMSRAKSWMLAGGSPLGLIIAAAVVAGLAGFGWVKYTKLNMGTQSQIERWVGPIFRHMRVFSAMTAGILVGLFLLWHGIYFGLILIMVCVGVAIAFIKEW